jgi:hypothetical protein
MINIKMPLMTHFACSDNKIKANRYMKANGQILYNQQLGRFARNFFMINMHKYITDYVKDYKVEVYPIEMELIFHLIPNYQGVRRVKGEIRFPKNPQLDPTYDLDNVSSLWKKAIQDTLTINKVITDDTANIIRKTTEEIIFIENPEEMFIEINIKEYV